MITNERIRPGDIRVIDEAGKQLGVMNRDDALNMAREKDLDLVLLNPNIVPPVCKIINYGKLRYEMQKKEKQARKSSKASSVLKELKLTPKISEHDYQVRVERSKEFLAKGHKVKIVVNFRGREFAHPEIGERHLHRMIDELKESGIPEAMPKFEFKNMVLIMVPK